MGAASPSRKKWHSGKNLHTPLPVNSVYQPMRKTSRIRQRGRTGCRKTVKFWASAGAQFQV
ncbi:hypothetical protein BCO26_0862 [Heyndrickxia coagulans 2-6]|nr:hypothetical protein BCO26_0862 [Heyndrickxia coagulans 2-6]